SGRRIVYGGGRVGVMGALAEAALAAGGEVVGVIPQSLVDREAAHRGLTELRVVRSMHERKAMPADLADGFLVLPGGLGTLEDLFEAWTWGQLGLHAKPYALLNVGGLFDPLLVFLDDLVKQRLLQPEHRAMLRVGTDPAALIADMAVYRPPYVAKWIDREST
ncbi:MAG: TIGR00730 family Rossman fold protein, partial [Planctomycetia bacterium]